MHVVAMQISRVEVAKDRYEREKYNKTEKWYCLTHASCRQTHFDYKTVDLLVISNANG